MTRTAARVPRLVIAAPASGSGKTTVTAGLAAALAARGLVVQPFKAGPDFLDPAVQSWATGRPARNLDLWMGSARWARWVFAEAAADADVALVEGVMGLFDGRGPDAARASTAHVARVLGTPVLLVVDARGMGQSLAALLHGFATWRRDIRIGGVIANQVGSATHAERLRRAAQAAGVPFLGWLPRTADLHWPDRHLGLVPPAEAPADPGWAERLARWVEQGVDVPAVLRLAASAPPLPVPAGPPGIAPLERPVRVAVAEDPAFLFYYRENLGLLEGLGAQVVRFSPLAGDPLPDAEALYWGGGFPEVHARRLAETAPQYRGALMARRPLTLAECGGMMYLARRLTTADGRAYPMVGVIPVDIAMAPRVQALGYRSVRAGPTGVFPPGAPFRGHEFHYSRVVRRDPAPPAWIAGDTPDGFAAPWISAGYVHLYFPSNPEGVRAWLARAAASRRVV
jgi:cobyrinic acid a,c-diamide synthase